ncbi:MAG TPA: sigma-54 dependent transcriptional regulator [Longimicrobiaceae bacterium]|nr:sigma-54 dependent transcriptional regulator [Longimicrobiaceae bacterium]
MLLSLAASPGAHPPTEEAQPDAPAFGFQTIVGRSRVLRDAVRIAKRMANGRAPVLLTGATGTGKELFARGIHYSGATAGEPFVAVNCGAIPFTVMESELFGVEHDGYGAAAVPKRGLVELAGAGTLFLDEVSALPLALQPKLLRILEERHYRRIGGVAEVPVNCRIVAASNVPLEEAVERGDFREDLFYRLNVYRLNLPRLRERDEDIELLARHFLQRIAQEQGEEPLKLSSDALGALHVHAWPGNVRELKNVIERAAVLCEGRTVSAENLLIQRRTSLPAAPAPGSTGAEIRIPPEGKTLAEIEREAVLLTLGLVQGNQSAAARILGISRPTLARKLRPDDASVGGRDEA